MLKTGHANEYGIYIGLALRNKFIILLIISISACDADPREVYIPSTKQSVELKVRSSAVEVSVGEPVVLYAERWSHGEWKSVEKKDLDSEQCWMRNPPSNHEKEVSDNLRWIAIPSKGARFNLNPRADHTREVIFEEPGIFILEPSSSIWCVHGQVAKGKPIKIIVKNGNGREKIVK